MPGVSDLPSLALRERPVRDAVDTGLIDASGVRIYRVTDRVPMGFRKG
jgi:hypothetical protein